MSNRHPSEKPLVSICIASYNRVDELYRCLKSVDTVRKDLIEIVVSEDCSPKRNEIAEIVDRFVSETSYSVTYNTNVNNLGFDRNFGKLIELAKGEYVLFMTDDDAFCGSALDRVIDVLRNVDCAAALTSYYLVDAGAVDRKFGKTMVIPPGISSVRRFLFSSILVSGLIFKRSRAIHFPAERCKDSIYFQVYLFASLLYRYGGCYIDVPLVECIGDGENPFGLSEASAENALLSDRTAVCSNLEFHKGLIRVVELFDDENGTDLLRSFSREYSLRSYTGMRSARRAGRRELTEYWLMMNSLDVDLSIVATIYYWALKLFGYRACDFLFQIPKKILLGLRKRHVAGPAAIP